jgi:hypothetical protein
VDLGPPAAGAALEHRGVVQQAIEQRGDGRGVAQQLAPVVCKNSGRGLRGVTIIEFEHAAKALAALDPA